MKCPKCGGTGEANMSNGMFAWKVECDECCGGGVVAPLTEEEYIQSCDTEQLAEWLQEHMDCIGCPASQEKCHRYYDACKEVMMEWLKQPHTIKEIHE